METLLKKKGLFPALAEKTVNKLLDDFTKDFDWPEKKFSELATNQTAVNLQETDKVSEVDLAAGMKTENFKAEIDNDLLRNSSPNEVRKKDKLARKEFNYRSFCRLPSL